jgi:hypothetical protein
VPSAEQPSPAVEELRAASASAPNTPVLLPCGCARAHTGFHDHPLYWHGGNGAEAAAKGLQWAQERAVAEPGLVAETETPDANLVSAPHPLVPPSILMESVPPSVRRQASWYLPPRHLISAYAARRDRPATLTKPPASGHIPLRSPPAFPAPLPPALPFADTPQQPKLAHTLFRLDTALPPQPIPADSDHPLRSALGLLPQRELPRPGTALYSAKLLTGRTHQLRVHFSDAGAPIRGDVYYNPHVVDEWLRRFRGGVDGELEARGDAVLGGCTGADEVPALALANPTAAVGALTPTTTGRAQVFRVWLTSLGAVGEDGANADTASGYCVAAEPLYVPARVLADACLGLPADFDEDEDVPLDPHAPLEARPLGTDLTDVHACFEDLDALVGVGDNVLGMSDVEAVQHHGHDPLWHVAHLILAAKLAQAQEAASEASSSATCEYEATLLPALRNQSPVPPPAPLPLGAAVAPDDVFTVQVQGEELRLTGDTLLHLYTTHKAWTYRDKDDTRMVRVCVGVRPLWEMQQSVFDAEQ